MTPPSARKPPGRLAPLRRDERPTAVVCTPQRCPYIVLKRGSLRSCSSPGRTIRGGYMLVLRPVRLVLVAFVALLPVPAARAATHMPIGFYDDASFRWSSSRAANLKEAAAAGASVIHTTANWPQIAPTRPVHSADG